MRDDHYAAKVGGRDRSSNNDFRYGFLLMGGDQHPRRRWPSRSGLKEMVMDKLIERELLATRPTSSASWSATTRSRTRSPTARSSASAAPRSPCPSLQKDGQFNYESFKTFVRSSSLEHDAQRPSSRSRRKRCWRRGCATSCARASTRLAGRGEGGVPAQEPPGQPRVHALHQPRATRRRSPRPKTRSRRYAGQERGQAEGDLRTEEVPLREGARPAPAPADPGQAARATPTRRPTRRRATRRRRWSRSCRRARRARQGALTFAELAKQSSDDRRPRGAAAISAGAARGGDEPAGRGRGQAVRRQGRRDRRPAQGHRRLRHHQGRGRARGPRPVRQGEAGAGRGEAARRSRANAQAKAAAEAALAKAKETPTATLKTMFPPPSDSAGGERPPTPAPRRASRRPGCSPCARPGRGGHRGDRRLERARQGGVRADAGRRRSPARSRSTTTSHRPAQGAEGAGPGRLREAQAGAGARSGAGEGGARAVGLDARRAAWRRRTRSGSR